MITMWTDILTTLVTGTSKISSLMIHGTRLSLPMVWLRRAWLGAGSASCSGVAPWSLCSYRSTTSRRRRGTWTGCLCTLAWMGVSGKMEACSLALGITQGTSQHCLGALFREVSEHSINIIIKIIFIYRWIKRIQCFNEICQIEKRCWWSCFCFSWDYCWKHTNWFSVTTIQPTILWTSPPSWPYKYSEA